VLLRVADLRTHVSSSGGVVRAVDGVDVCVAAGQTVALVGESGSGKSLTALSIMRLLPAEARIVSGSILFEGHDLARAGAGFMRSVRGRRIGMVFQEPMTSLNPVVTVGVQIGEPLRVHQRLSRAAARRRAIELLERVGLAEAERRCDAYPHELSGGMRQRVMIAMAVACGPALLIADEPTTALDVTLQGQIVALLLELQRASGMGLLFITHNLRLVSRIADQVYVLYAGRVVECGQARDVLQRPRHPYTLGLMRSLPRGATAWPGRADGAAWRFAHIPGEPPSPLAPVAGCAFHPRCELGQGDETCRSVTPGLEYGGGRACACWKAPQPGSEAAP